MKKIRVVYLVKIIEVLLPIYLNGTAIVPTTKDVTLLLNSRRKKNIGMHIMKPTLNKTVAESWFKRCFLFDILILTSCKEVLYNSTLTCQMLFSRGIFTLKFELPQ